MLGNNLSVTELESNITISEKFRTLVYGMYLNTMLQKDDEPSVMIITHRIISKDQCNFNLEVVPLSYFGDEEEHYRKEMMSILITGSLPAILVVDDYRITDTIDESIIGLPKIVILP